MLKYKPISTENINIIIQKNMGVKIMNKKGKNIELKIYEWLGIKTFRKIVFKFNYIILIPFTFRMTKEERWNLIHNTPSNYTMKMGNGIQDLKDFKKQLILNTSIHIAALICCIPGFLAIIENSASLFTIVTMLFFVPTNIYCVMLQRYNQIRINQVIKKGKIHEEAKKSKLKEELIEESLLLSKPTYKVVNKHNKEENITFEEFLETANYEQLKQYRNYLSQFMGKQSNNYTLDEKTSVDIPLQKSKTLKIEWK